jgi:DNA-binding LacI/PurR family transcriptional regulator
MGERMSKPPDRQNGPVTSRDVARLLGVSQSMISRAFDPRASVSPANRTRIVEAARALGYEPNVIARSLATRRSSIVAIVMGSMENPFYTGVLDQLAQALDEAGLRSLLFRVPPGQDVDDQLPALRRYNVDGLIVASASISSRIAAEWHRDDRRVVLINRTVPDASVASISCDNRGGGRQLADLLLDSGHKRLVYVAGPRNTSTNRDREDGFMERLMERNAGLVGRIDAGEYSFKAGVAAARRVAALKPDGIFFANDILALGGLDALRHELRLQVPGDVSVVGFDDIEMASWPSYQLTTIRQPVSEMVSSAVAAVTAPETARANSISLPGSLVERGSVMRRQGI